MEAPLLPLALVGALFAALLPAGPEDREALAREIVERAEGKAAKGHYRQALADYREAAERFGETAAGRTAAVRSRPNALLGWSDARRSGDSSNRFDVVLIGDGYELNELERSFHARADAVLDAFERDEVLAEYASYLNLVRAGVVSAERGVDGHGREYDTALGGYVMDETGPRFVAVDPALVLSYLDQLPAHDGVAVAIVEGESRGASLPGVATLGGALRDIEETFHALGHGLADLGDEFTDPNLHRFPPGPRPNVSASESSVPWQHWIDARHPGVGIYRGAGGRVTDLFRPVASNCVMNEARSFCPVCREALVLAIYRRVDGIDGCSPEPIDRTSAESLEPELEPTSTDRYRKLHFEVTAMKPARHDLEVRWWVLPEHRAPRTSGVRLEHDARARRGPLPDIAAEPAHEQRTSKSGRYEFELDPADHPPGRYRVVCRAVDTAEVRGEKHPWVLKDEAGLLQSERAWWVRVP